MSSKQKCSKGFHGILPFPKNPQVSALLKPWEWTSSESAGHLHPETFAWGKAPGCDATTTPRRGLRVPHGSLSQWGWDKWTVQLGDNGDEVLCSCTYFSYIHVYIYNICMICIYNYRVVFFGCCFWIIVFFLPDPVLEWSCELCCRICGYNFEILECCPPNVPETGASPRRKFATRHGEGVRCARQWREWTTKTRQGISICLQDTKPLTKLHGLSLDRTLKQATRTGWMVWTNWLDDLFEPTYCDSLKRKPCILGIRSSPGKLQALWPVSHVPQRFAAMSEWHHFLMPIAVGSFGLILSTEISFHMSA